MEIRLAKKEIDRDSIVDGEGIRSVIWTQGCPHHCPGCHNPKTHSFDGGYLIPVDKLIQEIDTLEGQDGVTFSGGDPMMQPKACSIIAKHCHEKNLDVWCYTGYNYEDLLEMSKKNKDIMDFLKEIDILVDGKFILAEKSFDVMFRGSKNQRLIDIKKSLKSNKVCQLTKYDNNQKNKRGRKNQYMFV